MSILRLIWSYKFPILCLILGLWLFISLSFPSLPIQSGQSSIATQIKIVEKIRTVTKEVKVLVPTPDQTKKLEGLINGPLPADPLNVVKTPALPNGAILVPFLTPEGTVDIQINPNKPKRIQFLRQAFLEGEYDLVNKGIDIGGGFDGIRIGRTKLGVKGGVQQEQDLTGLRVYLKGRVRVEF